MKIVVCQFLKQCDKGFSECPCPQGKVVFDKVVDAVVSITDSDNISLCPYCTHNEEDKA